MIRKLLKSKRGDGYIDVVVAVLVTTLVLVFALNIFNFFVIKQNMEYFAKEVVECACYEGKLSGEVYTRAFELSKEIGFYPGIAWKAGSYLDTAYYKVQLGEKISITLTYTTYVKGFGIFKIPITLTAKHSGVSQHYWK